MNVRNSLIFTLVGILSACGGGGGSSDGNSAPFFEGPTEATVRAEKAFYYTPMAFDPDGDNLTFRIDNKPDWAEFNPLDGSLSGIPQVDDYGINADIIITASDGKASSSFNLSVDVWPVLLGRDNFTPGAMTPTDSGYQSTGTLIMKVGDQEKRFEDSNLQLSFDAEGNLIDLVGETVVPKQVSDKLSLDADVKTMVGMYTGAQINANPDLGITLKDEFLYFVYYFGAGLDITVGDPAGSGAFDSITLDTPLAGQIVLITDPTDIFTYYFAAIPFVGEAGVGVSDNGFIPFIPQLDYAELDSFDGHFLDKGSFGLGVKIFDLFNISGTRVTRQPLFQDIDLDDPLASPIEYKMGINGDAEFALAVLGIGLFSFDLAKTSATLDVGLDRQQMAMQTVIAPDVSWVPSWFPFVPETETVGEWFVNGDGSYEATLGATYKSMQPSASLTGRMTLAPGAVMLKGTVGEGEKALGASATFGDNFVEVEIDVYADFNDGIQQTVTAALDNKLDELQSAFDNLAAATAQYEIELSLNGLRESLPTIANTAIPILNGIPATVRNTVDTAVVNFINNYKTCTPIPFSEKEVCIYPLKDGPFNSNSIGNSVGASARTQASNAIRPLVSALNLLKTTAEQADDELFKATIKNALQQAYNARTFSKKFTLKYNFAGFGNFTVYNKTFTKPVIPAPTATKIKLALDNVDNIQVTSNLKISAQQIFDALPVEEAINTAKQEVEQGVANIPGKLEGVGYKVESRLYTAYAILDGKRYEVSFNVLDPAELAAGIGELIANQLL